MISVKSASPAVARRLLAEMVGTAALVTVVVGSGIAAQTLSPNDVGLQLLENSADDALVPHLTDRITTDSLRSVERSSR
jgi:uncharacterized membrane protein